MATAKRKPLSFNTTMRNPDRIAGFLNILKRYENKILTNKVINNICCDVIMKKIYTPNIINRVPEWKAINDSEYEFTKEQAESIMEASPQQHKEAGFDAGWPSRFDTWYKLIMEFGLCYYEMNKPIEISDLGYSLIEAYSLDPIDNNMIENVFLNAMAKFQTSTPFRKNLNQNIPLMLLLRVLKLLKDDKTENGAGISRREIAFFICWPNNDAKALYKFIKNFRKIYGYNYSDETIYETCLAFFLDENHPTIDTLRDYIKMSKLVRETPDEYIRKMRITGIISLRGNGRFLDLNLLELKKINYLLNNYGTPVEISDKKEFYNYLKTKDDNLFEKEFEKPENLDLKQKALFKYANLYNEEKLAKELELTYKGTCTDDLLKFIDAPVRLEFLTSIALVKYFRDIKVLPHYSTDDEGIPRFTAGGGKADIDCEGRNVKGIVEVTLMSGASQQTEHEVTSIEDHLTDLEEKTEKFTMALFIAPILQRRALKYLNYLNDKFHSQNTNQGGIIPMLISEMIPKFKDAPQFRSLAN